MVLVKVAVAECVDELAHFQITLLGDHVGQQGIGRNIEGHAQNNYTTEKLHNPLGWVG